MVGGRTARGRVEAYEKGWEKVLSERATSQGVLLKSALLGPQGDVDGLPSALAGILR